MLETERYANDCDAAEGSEEYMEEGYFQSATKDPDHIHYNGEAATIIGVRLNIMSEWPKCKSSHLEQLESERDSDDGDAEDSSHKSIIKADHKSSCNQP